ncbi:MAG: M14 family zinc carboxypeptidase [Gemmatimonadota bacterium]
MGNLRPPLHTGHLALARAHRGASRARLRLAVGLVLAMGPVFAGPAVGQPAGSVSQPALLTPAERTRYLAFTRLEEMGSFLERLAALSPAVTVEPAATIAEGEHGRPILLVTLRDPEAAPSAAGRTRPVVLILAAQHGDEQSGKEAAMRLVRELAVGSLAPFLHQLDVLVLPMLNPWGVESGRRENEAGLDLNRDHLLLRSAATRAVHRVFRRFRPHVVLDLHELGPSAYDVQIGWPTHPNADSALVSYGRFYLLPYVARALTERSLTFREYTVPIGGGPPAEGRSARPASAAARSSRVASVGPSSDIRATASDTLPFFTYGPMEGSNARNAFALKRAVSFLLETASSRGIDGLAQRTESHFVMLRAFLEIVAARSEELVGLVEGRRRLAASDLGEGSAAGGVTLEARYAADPGRTSVTWPVRSASGAVVLRTIDRWRPIVRPVLSIGQPAAYLLEPSELGLVHLLLRHGLRVERLAESVRLRAGRYPVLGAPTAAAMPRHASSEAIPSAGPRGERPPVAGKAGVTRPADAATLLEWTELGVEEGSFLVRVAQPDAILLSTLVEPYSSDGWYRTREEAPEGAAGEGAAAAAGRYYPVHRLEEPFEGRAYPYRPE